jgi:serine/threonine-protein kinase
MRKTGLVIAALCGVQGAAFAQDKAAADAAFRDGRALMEAGRYAEACSKFQLSNELDPAIGTVLNLADCHEKQGRTASAWAEFNEVAERGARQADQRARADEAKRRAKALEPRLVRLKLTQSQTPPDLHVFYEESDVTHLVGYEFPVDPGSHHISLKRGGAVVWETTVDIAGEGKIRTVALPPPSELDRAITRPAQPTVTTRPAPVSPVSESPAGANLSATPPPEGLGTRRYVAIAAGGVGVLSLATALGFGLAAHAKYSDSHTYCNNGNVCTQAGLDLISAAKTRATAADVFGAVGLVAIAGGAVLWFTAPKRNTQEAQPDVRVGVSPALGPDQFGVSLQGAF